MENTGIVNPWVVVDYSCGRPPHIYKIRADLGDSFDVECCSMDESIFERLDNCYNRFPTIVDAVKDVAEKNGHKIEDFVSDYSVLFPEEKDNLVELL